MGGAHLSWFARTSAAGRLSTLAATRRGRYWSLWFTAASLALGAVGSVLVASWLGASDVADLVALRLLAYASWVYALVGLPALLHPDARPDTRRAFAKLRGVDTARPAARAFGLAERLFVGLLAASLPGLLVAAMLSTDSATLLGRFAVILLGCLFLAALALVLGLVGALSEQVAPKWPRLVAFVLLAGPFVVSLGVDWFPSVPGAFVWAFRLLTGLGGFG